MDVLQCVDTEFSKSNKKDTNSYVVFFFIY